MGKRKWFKAGIKITITWSDMTQAMEEFDTSRSTSRGRVVKRFAKWLVFQFQPMFIQRNSCFKSFTEHDPGFISQSSIRIRFVTIHLMCCYQVRNCARQRTTSVVRRSTCSFTNTHTRYFVTEKTQKPWRRKKHVKLHKPEGKTQKRRHPSLLSLHHSSICPWPDETLNQRL